MTVFPSRGGMFEFIDEVNKLGRKEKEMVAGSGFFLDGAFAFLLEDEDLVLFFFGSSSSSLSSTRSTTKGLFPFAFFN
jgi:hypothetical protein